MTRLFRRACVLLAVLAALAFPSVAIAAETPPPAASPADVEIPYLGDASIEPAAPWQIADCAPVVAATPLVTACDSTRITLAAPEYDPEAGVIVVRVPLTNGAVSTTVGYRVRLAAPDTPTARPAEATRPVAAGSLLRLPASELGLECVVCTGGGRLQGLEVEPASAGEVWATPTHLVFRAATGYTGPAEVGYRFADDYGTWSAGATVHANVYRPVGAPLVTFDLVVPFGVDGTASVELDSLATSLGDELVLVGCGAAMHGRVACAEGAATYSGSPDVPDQFAVQFAAGGEQATASVTLVPEASAQPAEDADAAAADASTEDLAIVPGPAALAPADQDEGVALAVTPPVPVEHHDTDGIFTPLIAALDRMGRT